MCRSHRWVVGLFVVSELAGEASACLPWDDGDFLPPPPPGTPERVQWASVAPLELPEEGIDFEWGEPEGDGMPPVVLKKHACFSRRECGDDVAPCWFSAVNDPCEICSLADREQYCFPAPEPMTCTVLWNKPCGQTLTGTCLATPPVGLACVVPGGPGVPGCIRKVCDGVDIE